MRNLSAVYGCAGQAQIWERVKRLTAATVARIAAAIRDETVRVSYQDAHAPHFAEMPENWAAQLTAGADP